MIEQSNQTGLYYFTTIIKNNLVTEKLKVDQIEFRPTIPIQVRQNPHRLKDFIIHHGDLTTGEWYHDNQFQGTIEVDPQAEDRLIDYYFGQAWLPHKELSSLYYVKKEPDITSNQAVNYQEIELPPSLIGFQYDQSFSYSDKVTDLLQDVKATWSDRFKRPMNPKSVMEGRYFPTLIDKVSTTFRQLAPFHIHLPLTIQLENTPFLVLDLEPEAGQAEWDIVNQYDCYYKEQSIRGGWHFICKVDPENKVFKYRFTPELEAQVNTQITLYRNGEWINDNPEPVVIDSQYEVGHHKRKISNSGKVSTGTLSPSEEGRVQAWIRQWKETKGLTNTLNMVYASYGDDLSYADFQALLKIYHSIGDTSLTPRLLAWAMARIAQAIIPYRPKHEDDRMGDPYLVYVAKRIIDYQQKQPRKENYGESNIEP